MRRQPHINFGNRWGSLFKINTILSKEIVPVKFQIWQGDFFYVIKGKATGVRL